MLHPRAPGTVGVGVSDRPWVWARRWGFWGRCAPKSVGGVGFGGVGWRWLAGGGRRRGVAAGPRGVPVCEWPVGWLATGSALIGSIPNGPGSRRGRLGVWLLPVAGAVGFRLWAPVQSLVALVPGGFGPLRRPFWYALALGYLLRGEGLGEGWIYEPIWFVCQGLCSLFVFIFGRGMMAHCLATGGRMSDKSSDHHLGLAVNISIEGLKALLLLNGGAATAFVALSGQTNGSRDYSFAILAFGVGATFAVAAFLAAYFSQLSYGNHRLELEKMNNMQQKKEYKDHHFWQTIAFVFVGLSLAAKAIASPKDLSPGDVLGARGGNPLASLPSPKST